MDSFSLLGIRAASITILCTLVFFVYRKKFKSNPQNEPKVSSSSRNWEHHVCSSFSFDDVPISFRNGIWNELRRRGFERFIDNEIKEGESIGPELRDAIRGSRIAIVILSENYYSSLRCRNELVEIIKCREELGQSVVTIFYEGDPIYVKHATDLGRYRQAKATAEWLDKAAGKQIKDGGETFGGTCEHITEDDKEERQIKALKEVSAINGYHFRYGDDETAVIEKIANNISNILNTTTQSSDFEGLVGMETHREEILCMDSAKTKTFEEKWQELITAYVKEDIYTSKRALEGTSKRLLHTVYIYCEDTLQYSFASHLCKDFCRKGIDASVNCTETLDVIERVSAWVVVFSKNCFSSTLYVYNLVRMLQLRRKTSQLVVPVFYGISPSDVMMQEHDSADRIKEWSTALHELRELPGYYSREESSECELVEEIVKFVHEKLFPAEQIGINSRLLEIEHLLCKQPWGIRHLGIWGMPGIGKTTIAKAFYDQISGRYEASCFIKHFDKAFIEKGAHCLLEEHFGEILKELPRVCSSITRPSFLGDKLKKKRTLVVLDDVQNPLVSESFLGGIHWFSPGSLIIITSRDKQVFHHCQIIHVYEVRSFTEKEALQLFYQCVCVKDMRKQNLLKLSMEVVDYANGNPLALSVYGRELKGKKVSEMETKFLKLKLRAPYEIHDLFTSSYETLNDIEKNIFLDIACFFEGENVDYVIQLLEGCGFFPRVGIHVLEEKCLVTISENKLKMHRIVQGFGREVNDGETIQIERFRRLWEPLTVKFLLEDDELKASGDLEENGGPSATYPHALVTEDIEGIFLDTSNLIFDVKPGAFENMLSLRFLNIYCPIYESCNGVRLPKGLESLPYELRLLHWENYPLQSLPQDFDPSHLVELNLPYSQLQKLWGGTKNLGKLKIARLCHSQQLTEIHDICEAQNIELIDLQGCTKLHIFPAMGQLKHLRVVNLSGCTEIRSFPNVSPNIEELHLQGTSIRELPLSTETLSTYVKLNQEPSNLLTEFSGVSGALNHDRLKSLVKAVLSNQLLGKLVCLNMRDCVQLKSLPHMADLEALKVLNLSGCSELEDIKGFPRNLKELYLAGTAIKELPLLPLSVEVVNAHGCVSLTSIPIHFEQLPRYYTFSNCFALSSQVVHLFVKSALTNVECIARKYQQEQNLNKSLTFSFTVPSLAMGKITFDMHSGSSVMIQLSSSWRNTLGFAILVEVAFSEDYHEDSGFGISCVYRWKDKKFVSHRLEKTFHCWTPGKGVPKDHVFVFCDFNMHPSTCEGIDLSILADLVVFEFFIVSNQKKFLESCTVTKCGVYVINTADLDTSTSLTKSYSSSEDYLHELSNNEVRDVLRVIYEGLDENERTLFLYIACIFNDEEANWLAPLIASYSLGISSGLKVLADKSLILISPYGVLVRHGLLQNIGRENISRQSTLSDSLLVLDRDFGNVIYDVVPSDVMQQVGDSGRALKNTGIRKSEDEKQKRLQSMSDENIIGVDDREWDSKANMMENLPHSSKVCDEDEVLSGVGDTSAVISEGLLVVGPGAELSLRDTAIEMENGRVLATTTIVDESSIKHVPTAEVHIGDVNQDTEDGSEVTASKIVMQLSKENNNHLAEGRSFYELDRTPLWGTVSIQGNHSVMEDAVAVLPNFLKLPIKMLRGDHEVVTASLTHLTSHFFGVYDGHGGSKVAEYCRDRLHFALYEEIECIKDELCRSNTGADRQVQWEKVFTTCFLTVDSEIGGKIGRAVAGYSDKVLKAVASETVGSTAIVALVCSSHIIVSNCGDSRAVLFRGHEAMSVSVDHRPDREYVYARIENAVGKVIGVLRSIGDRSLRPFVIPEPEVTFMPRSREDECLIIASDGLWDVMTNQEACEIARQRILIWHKRNAALPLPERGRGADPACQAAANYLSVLALRKGSKDNVSIIVVDLKAQRKFKPELKLKQFH